MSTSSSSTTPLPSIKLEEIDSSDSELPRRRSRYQLPSLSLSPPPPPPPDGPEKRGRRKGTTNRYKKEDYLRLEKKIRDLKRRLHKEHHRNHPRSSSTHPDITKTMSNAIITYDHKRAVKDLKYQPSIPKDQPCCFVQYDETFTTKVLGSGPKVSLIEQRADKFAHEAGVYIKPTGKEYFTSNFQSDRTIEVYSIDPATHEIEELHYDNVVNANGACNYFGRILFCSQGDLSTPSALVAVDPSTSESEILIDNFHGRPFNSVNDVVVHHATGDIWFTDPRYGYHQNFRPSPQLPSQVYRFRPSTGQIWCVADGFVECNGLCFSPNYEKMYITDTGAVQAHAGPGSGLNFSLNPRLPAHVYEFDVTDEGTRLGERRMFAYCDVGVPDGIKCDVEGNVYSGCGDGVHCWDLKGTLLGKIYTGGIVGNFNFAKDGVWIFGEERLCFAQIKAKGALVQVECE